MLYEQERNGKDTQDEGYVDMDDDDDDGADDDGDDDDDDVDDDHGNTIVRQDG